MKLDLYDKACLVPGTIMLLAGIAKNIEGLILSGSGLIVGWALAQCAGLLGYWIGGLGLKR